MKYIYYPGCSLEGTAREYNASTRAALAAMGVELIDLEDWTCCGASAAEATSYLLSMVLSARNLALAEKTETEGDFLIPCSACYINLRRVEDHIKRDANLQDKINRALEEENLTYTDGRKVRHLLDVLTNDFDREHIAPLVKSPLTGLVVAPYYGCQALRPYCDYDDPQEPHSMEPLIQSLGAEIHPWTVGAKCCGAALMSTKKEVAQELTAGILRAARGADCVVTICPMCQMNLEAYQKAISQSKGEELGISILYLPQLMGLAFGLTGSDLQLKLNLAITDGFKEKLGIWQTS